MSALSRAFTTRRVKHSIDVAAAARDRTDSPHRSNTVRHKISAPLELIHTTNMLSYNAPDIRPRTNSNLSSTSSTKSSDDDSDSHATVTSSPPTSPDVSPHELDRSMSPEPNHLSCYFMPPGQAINPPATIEAPVIPQRSPSHTKKASYEALSRQRSISRMSKDSGKSVSTKASMTFSRSSSASTAASSISHTSMTYSAKPPVPPVAAAAYQPYQQQKQERSESHPFGRELAQVTEIAEEYGIKEQMIDEEERALKAQGLRKFTAEDYLGEIQGLFANFFNDGHPRPMAMAWI